MEIHIDSPYRFSMELRSESQLAGMPLVVQDVGADVGELVEESFVRAVLAERLPPEPEWLRVRVRPRWSSEPLVDRIEIALEARENGTRGTWRQAYASGRWVRTAQLARVALEREGTVQEGETVYRLLVGTPEPDEPDWRVPPLAAPPIVDQSLEALGVRQLGAGSVVPDLPVLVNERFVREAIRACERSGTIETGGAVLGKVVRLPKPLPGAATRITTVLSATLDDPRHQGEVMNFTFSVDALDEAARVADLRGLGERVVTVYHTHGWKPECAQCPGSSRCPLVECRPSLQDYQMIEALFPSKATLVPIVGRKSGAATSGPVFEVHAWRGGQLCPIRWQAYQD